MIKLYESVIEVEENKYKTCGERQRNIAMIVAYNCYRDVVEKTRPVRQRLRSCEKKLYLFKCLRGKQQIFIVIITIYITVIMYFCPLYSTLLLLCIFVLGIPLPPKVKIDAINYMFFVGIERIHNNCTIQLA